MFWWCLCVVTLLLGFFVGVGAFVIGLSQISSFSLKFSWVLSMTRSGEKDSDVSLCLYLVYASKLHVSAILVYRSLLL